MAITYSLDVTLEICDRLAQGESLRGICEDLHMPSASNVLEWVHKNKDGFAERYAHAREIGYLLLADEIVRIADTPQIGTKSVSKATGLEITEGDMIEHRRLQVDTRKWMLAKMLPKIYGDRQVIEHAGAVDIVGILSEARKRSGST